jgi:hypothetical protein
MAIAMMEPKYPIEIQGIEKLRRGDFKYVLKCEAKY